MGEEDVAVVEWRRKATKSDVLKKRCDSEVAATEASIQLWLAFSGVSIQL
jgi:hypothetical protein